MPASYYRDGLVHAVAAVLRERDGVNATPEVVGAQLQTGRFLILFDGVSEVEQDDKEGALREMLRAAQSAEYGSCRFMFATRPVDGTPPDVSVFELRPLTRDVLQTLIPGRGLGVAEENRLRHQLEAFGDSPLDPMLFAMAVTDSGSDQVSRTRAALYERYFQRLLRLKPADVLAWRGWREALEFVAEWALLKTGRRGVGLRHEDAVNRLSQEVDHDGVREGFVKRLNRLYPLRLKTELELLEKLSAAGVLHFDRRWRFTHDTFEEFFAAGRLASRIDETGGWSPLDAWAGREVELCDVMAFLAELCDTATLTAVAGMDVPVVLKERLSQSLAALRRPPAVPTDPQVVRGV
ncbi:MAG: hypothetical protein ACXVHC_08460 [Frankiaceae bacterium]